MSDVSDTNERYVQLAMNYGVDVSLANNYYDTTMKLLIEMMEHLQRLDKIVYRAEALKKIKPFNPLEVIGDTNCRGHDMISDVEVMSIDEMYKRVKEYDEYIGNMSEEERKVFLSGDFVRKSEGDKVSDDVNIDECWAVQHSCSMVCERCGLTWDINDPEPPACDKEKPSA